MIIHIADVIIKIWDQIRDVLHVIGIVCVCVWGGGERERDWEGEKEREDKCTQWSPLPRHTKTDFLPASNQNHWRQGRPRNLAYFCWEMCSGKH